MNVIDADAHVIEGTTFGFDAAERWPEHFAVRTDGKLGFVMEGRNLPEPEGSGAGCPPEWGLSAAQGIDPWSVAGVLADADREEIDQMVLFPSLALCAPTIEDAAFAEAFARAYNDWIAGYCAAGRGRLHGVGVLPLWHVHQAVRALVQAHDLGLVAAVIPPTLPDRNLDDPRLEPVYTTAEERGIPLCVHGAPGLGLPKIGVDRFENYVQVHCVSFPFDQMTAMTSLISGGVLERHPRLRVAFLEAGCGWVPYFLARLHEHWERRGDWVPEGWGRDPWDYVHRGQVYVSCEPEEPLLGQMTETIGEDFVLYASDYPHWDSGFPDTVSTLRGRSDLKPGALNKILCDNAARLFGLVGAQR